MPLARLARRWLPAAEIEQSGRRVDVVESDSAGARWTALVVHDDWVVPTHRQSLVAIPGATTVHLTGTDHVDVLHNPRAITAVCAATTTLVPPSLEAP